MRAFGNRRPTRQPYVPTGLIPTKDPITSQLYKIGQVGPRTENRWMMQHGRFLSGFGSNDTQPAFAAKPDGYVESLEKDDDVYGSGVFDSYGRKPTVNPTLGVFADHPSIPGYIDREVQYAVSKDVVDITSGADVVVVPGGGLTYQERGGLPVPFDRTGEGPTRPSQYLEAGKKIDDVFIGLTDESYRPPQHMQNVMEELEISDTIGLSGSDSSFTPHLVHAGQQAPVGQHPSVALVPSNVSYSPVRSVDTSRVSDLLTSIPAHRPGQAMRLPQRSIPAMTSSYTPRVAPMRALAGEETEEKYGVGTYLVAGLLVGAAAGMVYHATKKVR